MFEDNTETLKKVLEPFIAASQNLLVEALDDDKFKTLKFLLDSIFELSDAKESEDLKNDNLIYKVEYAVGQHQGSFIILIPETLVSIVSDVLTGGKGEEQYKGILSELEINSISNFITTLLKDVESLYKKIYNKDLAFSSNPSILTKESENFSINATSVYDLCIGNILSLESGKNFSIPILWSVASSSELIAEIGLGKISSQSPKQSIESLNIEHLSDVKINVTAELGRTRVPIKYALELVRGSLIELDTLNGSDIKVFANGVEFAYAQIVAIEENFGLKITKIIPPEERLECL